MKRALTIALVLATIVPAHRAWAGKGDDEDEEASEDEDEDKPAKSSKPDKSAKKGGDDEESSDDEDSDSESKDDEDKDDEKDEDGLRSKQNLSGRDEGTEKKVTEFEKDRFFVDKVDTEATEKGTLVQGSIASSSFFYGESGGQYPSTGGSFMSGDNAGPKRLFTELRLQTDFRHIAASRWEARIDARGRFVGQPGNDVGTGATPGLTTANHIQSGLLGENEAELRELWLIRSGKRSDVFIGRQFIPDLGGIKIDGLRVDYAKSSKLTLIGFGGLMPVRGSRSLTTDYQELKNEKGEAAGRFVATGGFGGAYRTVSSYGAVGGVVQYPLQGEDPRVYVTSNGYLRKGAKLDFYHYVLMDLLGSAASDSTSHIQLTNLSAGVNFKPNPRLRLTGAFHRVDTETLAVQAGAYLSQPDTDPNGIGNTIIQSDTYLKRIATNTARAGVSAGLGPNQRFEISTALSYRFRPAFTLQSPDKTVKADLPEASSVEVWGSFVDRRSIKNARIGIEASRSFAVGQLAYQRSVLLIGRLFVLRELANGKGEWEAEASFSDVRDTVLGMNLGCAMVSDCYGTSSNTLVQLGGQVFYRLKQDWFGIATLHVLRTTNTRSDKVEDPATLGVTGFVRIAKRF